MRLLSVKPVEATARVYRKPKSTKTICVFDCETDPFAHGVTIKPFTCGFFDGEQYIDFWGDDCISQFADYIDVRRNSNPKEKLLIFAHNLGGFDIHFLYDYFDSGHTPLVIGSRICQAQIFGHEWRDSYKIIAAPLRAYQKDDFDYTKLERHCRETYRDEILLYQRHDCEYLFTLVSEFFEMFGDRITIGNCAINMLESFHGYKRLIAVQDRALRPYFYGGRCQCLETGVLKDDWKVYDVNSMYPHVMAHFSHPIGNELHRGSRLAPNTAFARIDCVNDGALPERGGMGELSFKRHDGIFLASIHEINAGIETGSLRIRRVLETFDFVQWGNFKDFVYHFYDLRLEAKANGDKLRDLYYKLLLNNAYGKFAQSPERYSDYVVIRGDHIPNGGLFSCICKPGEERHTLTCISEANPGGWTPRYSFEDRIIYERDQQKGRKTYFNVATGASITAAARAELLRGIRRADRPIYCDTDSIICRTLNVDADPTKLGAWKLEATGDTMAIAGKKMYALFENGAPVKQASKGSQLSALEVLAVANGGKILYKSAQPTFALDGSVTYIEREIQATS